MTQQTSANIPAPSPPHEKQAAASALGLGDAAVQTNLHHFVASLWLHFFQVPATADNVGWKECERRRRRNFLEAGNEEACDFIAGIAAHIPENHKSQCVALMTARVPPKSLIPPAPARD